MIFSENSYAVIIKSVSHQWCIKDGILILLLEFHRESSIIPRLFYPPKFLSLVRPQDIQDIRRTLDKLTLISLSFLQNHIFRDFSKTRRTISF